MQLYALILAGFGLLVLLTAWLPMVLRQMPLSLPILCVTLGIGIGLVPGFPGVPVSSPAGLKLVDHATELTVVIALMGAGLKIDRVLGWSSWLVTWRLLFLAMPLTIAALTGITHGLLGIPLASALLLAASLSPTDPVLASDVQVGPPLEGEEDEIRFALTSEAGLNDGLAFPFVWLAVYLAEDGLGPARLAEWAAVAILWKLGAGIVIGFAVGRGLGWLTFRLPIRSRLSRSGAGFVALGIACIAYGATELLAGYGFVGVFMAALALRGTERGHAFHRKLHDFMEELERILTTLLLVGLGAAIGAGLLAALTWQGVAAALLAIFVVRPLCAWASLLGCSRPASETAVVSFYGIRGIGTIYYLAWALQRDGFAEPELLWSVAALTIVMSIALHGATVTPVLTALDRRTGRDTESAQLSLKLKPSG